MIKVNQILEIEEIQIILINNIIQGVVFFEKTILFMEIVGTLLIIRKPINPRLK